MLLLRSLPVSSSTADGTCHAQDRALHAEWGRETCIIWGRSRHADFGPYTHTLSIRTVWGGAQCCHVGGRTLAVDDDNFLILNPGRIYSTSIRAARAVELLAIYFHPQLVEDFRGGAATIEQVLNGDGGATEQAPDFMENLQPHDDSVSPVLRYIRAHMASGLLDQAWYEEQLLFLLSRMQAHREKLLQQIDRFAHVRRATRWEVYRRIGLATDHIHTHYAGRIDLDTLARIACLSKYHFLRLFTVVHGVTPRVYLQRKRTGMAVRLLESSQLTLGEIASNVGFVHESTLFRQMRRWMNLSPRQVRTRNHALQPRPCPDLPNVRDS
jgi:AraC family transcriptional regulator